MESVYDYYVTIQSVANPDIAFVQNQESKRTKFVVEQNKKFLDVMKQNLERKFKKLGIEAGIFLVREYSENVSRSKELDCKYLHAHILMFIPKEQYSDFLLEDLEMKVDRTESRKYHVRNQITKSKQFNTTDSLARFISYLCKDLTPESKEFEDYMFYKCPVKDYILAHHIPTI